mgnify:CR=1 FL=1
MNFAKTGSRQMKYLVIVAHPVEDSLAKRSAYAVEEELSKAGHAVELLDLYKHGFDPVLSEAGLRAFRTQEHRPSIRALHDQLRSAQGLVLCYPTWWHGPPAILKGYLEQMFVPGVGYEVANGKLRPLLTGLTRIDVLTSYNSPWWLVRLFNLSADRSALVRGVKLACAPRAVVRWHAMYRMARRDRTTVLEYVQKIRASFRGGNAVG